MSDTQQTGDQQINGEVPREVDAIMGGMVALFGTVTVASGLYLGYPHQLTYEAALLTVMAVFGTMLVHAAPKAAVRLGVGK